MGIGEITKQFAKEAIGDQVKDILGTGRPAVSGSEATTASVTAEAEGLSAVLMGQVQAMQSALREDQELSVQCMAAGESVRVLELFAPTSKVLVVTGHDASKSLTRIVSPADSVQLVCKPFTLPAGTKASRIRFVTPAPKTK